MITGVRSWLGDCALALGRPQDELVDLLGRDPATYSPKDHAAAEAITLAADEAFRTRRYTPAIVNHFYVSARAGGGGEQTFIGGTDALKLHGYPPAAIESLPSSIAARFLGLGNVWRGVEAPVGHSVLDVGCGAGVDLAIAAQLSGGSAVLFGFDKRDELFELARAACPDAEFAVADVESLSSLDRRFDVVIANGLPPLQRPTSLTATAERLLALATPGGVVSATVLVAEPAVVAELEEEFSDGSGRLADSLATLLTGKPTVEAVRGAFAGAGSRVTSVGENPYRDPEDRKLTAMVEVVCGVEG